MPLHIATQRENPGDALHPPPTPGYAAPMEDGWTRTDTSWTEAGRWLNVRQAASVLGASSDAIRKRIARGTLPSRKLPDGSVQVRLDVDQPGGGTEAGRASDKRSAEGGRREELVESLQEQVRYLREVLNEERDARRRADTIIVQLTQANAFLARRVPELAPPQEVRDGHETPAAEPEGVEHPPATEGAQEGAERRSSWWRRWFGFE